MTGEIWLIAGLGNPGTSYEKTRHNIGFMLLDHLASIGNISISKEKFNASFGRGRLDGMDVILAKPMAFMNRSGPPLRQLAGYFNVAPENMLVMHDDIDLPFAKLRIKEGGGHGGHNGIKSIMESFGSGKFNRLRMGVGRPDSEREVTDHVLGKFSQPERKDLQDLMILGSEAVSTILCSGMKKGMNSFN